MCKGSVESKAKLSSLHICAPAHPLNECTRTESCSALCQAAACPCLLHTCAGSTAARAPLLCALHARTDNLRQISKRKLWARRLFSVLGSSPAARQPA